MATQIKSLDKISKAIETMHDRHGFGKIQTIIMIRDVAGAFGIELGLRDAKTLVDAIYALNGWDANPIEPVANPWTRSRTFVDEF